MAKKQFDDPIDDIEPVMDEAFSMNDPEPDVAIEVASTDNIAAEAGIDAGQTAQLPLTPEPVTDTAIEIADDLDILLEEEYPEDTVDSPIAQVDFPELDDEAHGRKLEVDMFQNIPVNLSVELGRSQISLKEVYELTEGSIIELERLVGEPLDLVVNGQAIAQGEVVAIDNNYGLRITSITSKSNMS